MNSGDKDSNRFDSKSLKTVRIFRWQILEKETGLKFYLNGRIVLGSKMYQCLALLIHMTATLTLFLLHDGNHYLDLDGTMQIVLEKLRIPFMLVFLYFLTLMAILNTILTEPGYVPKPSEEQQRKNFLEYISKLKFRSQEGPQTLNRYCQICQQFRQPQVSHCRTCNVCFKRCDHHCRILGVCIGERNYPSFFIFTILLMFFYGVILTLGFRDLYNVILAEMNNLNPAHVALPSFYLVLSSIFYPPCGILILFTTPFTHAYQILTNRTSKNVAHGIWPPDKPSTFKGWISFCTMNCARILFSPKAPSQLFPREQLEVERTYLEKLTRAQRPEITKELYDEASYEVGVENDIVRSELDKILNSTSVSISSEIAPKV